MNVDILIGGDFYWNFFEDERIRAKKGQNGSLAENTILGWVVCGPCEVANVNVPTDHVSTHVLKMGVEPPRLCEEQRKV